MKKKIKLALVTGSLVAVALLGGCGKDNKPAKTTEATTEQATTEAVREVTPLTLGEMDKLLLDSAFVSQMKQNGSTVTTTVGDTTYEVKLVINETEYTCTFNYEDNVLSSELKQDASGYLAYMFSNYIANVVSDNFGNGAGYIDYLYNTAQQTGELAGDFEKYGFSISSNEVKISLNDINFTDYDLRDVALTEDDISNYLATDGTYIFSDKYSISISNGFISLTTDNNAADWYEVNIVALDNGKLDTKQSVYDTFSTVAGYYNNGDNTFFTGVVTKDMKSVSTDDLTFEVNNPEKLLSVITTSTLKEDDFTVYTLKFKRTLVNPVTAKGDESATEQSDTSKEKEKSETSEESTTEKSDTTKDGEKTTEQSDTSKDKEKTTEKSDTSKEKEKTTEKSK